MSNPANDAIIDRAELDAIEFVLDKGVDQDHPGFDKLVDIKFKELVKEAMEAPGPHG